MRTLFCTAAFSLALCVPGLAADPNEMPVKLVRSEDGFDYIRRVTDIPMRDGVKLHTGGGD